MMNVGTFTPRSINSMVEETGIRGDQYVRKVSLTQLPSASKGSIDNRGLFNASMTIRLF